MKKVQNTENRFGIQRVKSLSHMKKQAMSSPASLVALRTLLVWEWLLTISSNIYVLYLLLALVDVSGTSMLLF